MPAGRDSPIGPGDFGVGEFTVPAVLDARAGQCPDRVMLSVAGTPVTFSQLRQRSCAAANVLLGLGVRPGDTVALFAATCPEWVYFWLGAARMHAVPAAVNVANKGDFLLHALRLAQARVVLTDPERYPRTVEVIDGLETVNTILVAPDPPPGPLGPAGTAMHGVTRLLGNAPTRLAAVPAPPGCDRVGALFFTSGTTGPSKAVATNWNYLFSVAARAASAWEFSAGEVVWSAMPLFHLSAAPLILAPMLVGGTTVLSPAFRPSEVWDDIRACRAVGFVGAGAMVSMLLHQPPDPRDAELPLRFISAAPIAAEMYPTIKQRYRCRIVTMYGLTEAFPIALKAVGDDDVPGASGRPNPDFDVRVVDADLQSRPAGEVGEIACRPRLPNVMSMGYLADLADPADPADLAGRPGLPFSPHDEWFRTGDLGILDAQGNLTYVDRLKDSLRRRGENISSVEVETTVMGHPAVAEAAAVGIPSDLGEDDILVVVSLRDGAVMDYAEFLDFCSARMPYFCVPRYVEVLEEIPKNPIGRVRKDLLRSRGLGSGAWDRERHHYIVSR
jgi:carnitine-CoA ligase